MKISTLVAGALLATGGESFRIEKVSANCDFLCLKSCEKYRGPSIKKPTR